MMMGSGSNRMQLEEKKEGRANRNHGKQTEDPAVTEGAEYVP